MDSKAPHGYDDNGAPIAPYGYLKDGVTPRKSNRGARPGQRGNGNRAAKGSRPSVKRSANDETRKAQLCALGEMVLISPLAAASMTPAVKNRIGTKQADALAGDAVILTEYLPHIADGLIVLSQSKPGMLGWLDTIEENAPYLLLANVGVQVAKALVSNHMNPNPRLANAGRLQAGIRSMQLVEMIEAQAAEMGVGINADDPTIPIPTDEAA